MVRISEIEIHPRYLQEYKKILKEEAAASVKLEPGVIGIFPMYQKENPTQVRILEMYASKAAYEQHLQTPHFRKYKTTTMKMVKSLKLVDMTGVDMKTMPLMFKKSDSVLATILKRSVGTDTGIKNTTNTIFPKGVRVTNNNFTGAVWVQMLVGHDTAFNTSVGNVTFEPGSRTNWHYHPGGQILLVTGGKGRYQEEGKPVRELHPGDIIKCEPNTRHWHGAAPDSGLSHVAIGTNTNRGAVVWLQAVTNEEYNR